MMREVLHPGICHAVSIHSPRALSSALLFKSTDIDIPERRPCHLRERRESSAQRASRPRQPSSAQFNLPSRADRSELFDLRGRRLPAFSLLHPDVKSACAPTTMITRRGPVDGKLAQDSAHPPRVVNRAKYVHSESRHGPASTIGSAPNPAARHQWANLSDATNAETPGSPQ